MSDRIVRALIKDSNLIAVACIGTELTREARRRHGLAPSSAALLGQGLVSGLLVAALQKEEQNRINIQLECDGPARGFFVDANTAGHVRGYIRNKSVNFPLSERFVAKPLLGGKGYLSVLRDLDGQFYRGSVGLDQQNVSLDLEHYFHTSEQVDTTVQIEALPLDSDELGWVGGVLFQRLPDGDSDALAALRSKLRDDAVVKAVKANATSAHALLEHIVPRERMDLLVDHEAQYLCPCSRDRVLRALSTLTNLDIVEMIQQDKKASIDCDFCGQHYEISEEELRAVLDLIDERDARVAGKQRSGGEKLN
jgi:molecular chaperone Hsp33